MKRSLETMITTDEHGNAHMVNVGLFNEFMKQNPGEQFHVKVTKRTSNLSNQMIRYFWAEPIRKMQMGLKASGYDFDAASTESFIKQFFPIMYDEVELNNELVRVYKSIRDLSNDEMIEYIDAMKRFAAENFSIIINEPKS